MIFKPFHIPAPCSENWNEMDSSEQGAFCQKCNKEVVDLTVKKPSEIHQIMSGKTKPCIRILGRQIDEMNWIEWFNSLTLKRQLNSLFLLAFVFVFHLNGRAQDQDSTLIRPNVSQTVLPIDSTETDTNSIFLPEVLIVDYRGNTDTYYKLEEDYLVGIPLDHFNGDQKMYGLLPDIVMNHNEFYFSFQEGQLVLNITGKQAEKVDIRIYDENGNLKYADQLHIEKGWAEIPFYLINAEHSNYTIHLDGFETTKKIQLNYY